MPRILAATLAVVNPMPTTSDQSRRVEGADQPSPHKNHRSVHGQGAAQCNPPVRCSPHSPSPLPGPPSARSATTGNPGCAGACRYRSMRNRYHPPSQHAPTHLRPLLLALAHHQHRPTECKQPRQIAPEQPFGHPIQGPAPVLPQRLQAQLSRQFEAVHRSPLMLRDQQVAVARSRSLHALTTRRRTSR